MPFEAGAFELIFLSAVALIVVGPKDLPILLRKVGQFTARMRGLANEFRASFDEMARQSELDELRREVEALRSGRFVEGAIPAVEGHFQEIEAHLTGAAQVSAYGREVPALASPSPAEFPEPQAVEVAESAPTPAQVVAEPAGPTAAPAPAETP